MTTLPVVIPAGGTIDGSFSEAAGTPIRCLAPISSQPVLQRVVRALKATGAISTVVAAAPAEVHAEIVGVDLWAQSGKLGTDSIRNGLNCLDNWDRVLICTSDLPFLTSESIMDFIDRSDPEADISMGLVSAADYNSSFPNSPESIYVSLRETGPITIGCLFILSKTGLERIDPWLDRLFNARKNLFQSAMLLGPAILGQLVVKRLSLHSLQQRAKGLIGIDIDVVVGVSARLAFDIDTVEDYDYAKNHI